jgi:hypothetical protein
MKIGRIKDYKKSNYIVNFIDGTTESFVTIGCRDRNDHPFINNWLLFDDEGYAEIISNPYKPLFDGRASIRFERNFVIGPNDHWFPDYIGKIGKNTSTYNYPTFEVDLITEGRTWVTDDSDESVLETGQWIFMEGIAYEGCGDAGIFPHFVVIPSPYHIPSPPIVKHTAKPGHVHTFPSMKA